MGYYNDGNTMTQTVRMFKISKPTEPTEPTFYKYKRIFDSK